MVLKAIHGYDPEYSAKIRQLVMAIQNDHTALMGDQIITAADFTLGFDCDKQLRWLSKKGILEAVRDPEARVQKIIGFRVAQWPPKNSLINTKPIGLTYHIQKAFRYALEAYITEHMKEIDTNMLLKTWCKARRPLFLAGMRNRALARSIRWRRLLAAARHSLRWLFTTSRGMRPGFRLFRCARIAPGAQSAQNRC
jgi:hypothetical protein